MKKLFILISLAFTMSAEAATVAPVFTNDTVANSLTFNDSFGHTVTIGMYNPVNGLWTSTGVAGGFTNLTVSGNATVGGTTGLTGQTTVGALTATGLVNGAGFTALFASPPPIGSTVASTGAFTTLSATGAISGAGFSSLISAPPVGIGSVTPNGGAFTTLSASSTVSGAGFANYLLSPPAIGNTAANTGKFTTFEATGAGLFDTTLGVTGAETLVGNLNMNGGIIKSGTEFTLDYINVNGYGAGAWITSQADAAGVAATFATRTKNWAGGAALQVGAIHWCFADMPTGTGSAPCWAQYSESRKYPGTTGNIVVFESDISNFKALSALDPYSSGITDLAANLWLQSGGGCSGTCYNPLTTLSNLTAATNPAHMAIGIGSNVGQYYTGITVFATAISGVNGVTTGVYGPALQMALGHEVEWRGAAGVVGGSITSQATSATNRARQSFINGGIVFAAAGNANPDFQINTTATHTAGIFVQGDAGGNTPTLGTFGTQTNINLAFSTKGTGQLVINGVAAVSCSGVTAGTVVVTNGIITHC